MSNLTNTQWLSNDYNKMLSKFVPSLILAASLRDTAAISLRRSFLGRLSFGGNAETTTAANPDPGTPPGTPPMVVRGSDMSTRDLSLHSDDLRVEDSKDDSDDNSGIVAIERELENAFQVVDSTSSGNVDQDSFASTLPPRDDAAGDNDSDHDKSSIEKIDLSFDIHAPQWENLRKLKTCLISVAPVLFKISQFGVDNHQRVGKYPYKHAAITLVTFVVMLGLQIAALIPSGITDFYEAYETIDTPPAAAVVTMWSIILALQATYVVLSFVWRGNSNSGADGHPNDLASFKKKIIMNQ